MLPRLRPYVRGQDLRWLFRPNAGLVDEFERRFADLTGSQYALLLPYGRSALYFFLTSLGITDAEIILPAYNCQSVLGPIFETRNTPVVVDSLPDQFNLNAALVQAAITPNTRVIMASAIYGSPLPLEAYQQFRWRDIYLIGDYALGLFTFLTEQAQHALETFDLIFFSFGLGKELTFLGGGAMVTNDVEIYSRLKLLRDTLCQPPNWGSHVKMLVKFLSTWLLFQPPCYRLLYLLSEKTTLLRAVKGTNIGVTRNLPRDFYLMPTSFQIHLALDRLTKLPFFLEKKRALLTCQQPGWHDAMSHVHDEHGCSPVRLLPNGHLYSHLPIFVPQETRNSILAFLVHHGIHSTILFKHPLNHFYPSNSRACIPHAQHHIDSVILLPLYYDLSLENIDKILRILQQGINNSASIQTSPRLRKG